MYVQIYGQTSYPLHYTGDSPFGAVAKNGVVEKEGRSGNVEWVAVLCPWPLLLLKAVKCLGDKGSWGMGGWKLGSWGVKGWAARGLGLGGWGVGFWVVVGGT